MTTSLLFALSLSLLLFAGSLAVGSITRVAGALRMPAFTTGIVIMSLVTATPALLVGIDASLAGQPELALGNALGTPIVNLGLILGILLIRARSVQLSSQIFRRDLVLTFTSGFLVYLLAFDGTLSRLDGSVLILIFFLWLTHIIHERRAFHDVWSQGPAVWGCFGALGSFAGAILLLFLSANWTVETGLALAAKAHIPDYLLGVLAIAIGTSLAELVFAFRAAPLGKTQFSIGNLIGVTTITGTFTLGLASLIHPIIAPTTGILLLTAVCLLGIAAVTLSPLVFHDGHLRRSTGWTLILVFVVFVIGQILFGR